MTLTVGPNAGLLINGDAREEHYLSLMRQWRGLDGLIQCHVKDKDLNTPPGSPADGDMYIVGPSPTGAWSSHAGELARYYSVGVGSPGWEFYTPKAGWEARVEDETDVDGVPKRYVHTGSTWVAESSGGIQAIVAGPNITVDNTDPANPVVSASNSGGDVVGPANSANNEIALFDGASGKSLKRGPVVGTAASANRVTSLTDTTAGSIPIVGWMGLGASITTNTVTLATVEGNQFGRVDAADPDNPAGSAIPVINLNISGSAFGAQILVARGNDSNAASGGIYYRGKNTTFNTMRKVWDSQNLVKTTSATDTTAGRMLQVGDGGLLSSFAPSFPGFNVAKTIGWYRTNAIQDFAGAPAGASGAYVIRLDSVGTITMYQNSTTSANRRIYQGVSSSSSSAPSAWIEYIHTGNTSADVQTMLGSANNADIRSAISASSLPPYTLATVPSAAANANLLIVITDLTGGREPCFSDGTDWLRCSDKTIAD